MQLRAMYRWRVLHVHVWSVRATRWCLVSVQPLQIANNININMRWLNAIQFASFISVSCALLKFIALKVLIETTARLKAMMCYNVVNGLLTCVVWRLTCKSISHLFNFFGTKSIRVAIICKFDTIEKLFILWIFSARSRISHKQYWDAWFARSN